MIHALNFSFRQRIKLGFNHTVYGLSGTIINFIFSILIVRLFSVHLWGSFAQLMLMMTLFSQITGWGNKDFLLREFSRQSRLTALWQTSLMSRFVIFFALVPFLFFFPFAGADPPLFSLWLLANFLLRSFDSVIVFERRFKEAIGIEVIGFLAIVALLFALRDRISLSLLILLFLSASLLKTLLYCLLFRKPFLHSVSGTFDFRHLVLCLPYFLPLFIGFLNAKADTFAISIKLSRRELGEYYVLSSLLSYCYAIPVLVVTPFLKNFYRINQQSFNKIRRVFLLAGLLWSLVCICAIYFIMEFFYQIHLPFDSYLIGWLALPPYFVYFLLMQQFIKDDKPYSIVMIYLPAAVLNFFLSLMLIDRFGFNGGLIAGASLQWIVMIGFLIISKEKQFVPKSQ